MREEIDMVLLGRRDAVRSESPPARQRLRSTTRAAVAPLAVGLVAALYVGIGAWIPSVWYDEAATVTSATRSWAGLAAELQRVDIVHGLYYSGMHLWFDVVGYSPFTLRLPSAIAVGLAAGLLVVALRAASGIRLAVLSGLVLPLLPRVAWAGGEGRSFALGILATVALSAILWRALRTGRRRWWIAYGIAGGLAGHLFLYLLLVVVAHAVTVAWLALSHRIDRRTVTTGAVVAAAIAAACTPIAILARAQGGQLSWIPPAGAHTARFVLAGQWFGGSWTAALVLGLIALGGIVVLLVRRSELAAWVVPLLVVPTALLIAASAVVPLYSPRYVAFTAPAVAVAMGAALAALPTRPARLIGLGAVLAVSAPLLVTHLRQPDSKQNSTWSEVATFIAERRAADPRPTAILWGPVRYHLSATARVIEYSYPDAFAGTIDPTLRIPAADSGRLWEYRGTLADSLGTLQQADAAYLVTSVKRDWIPSYTATLSGAGWTPAGRWRFGDVNVVEFRPDA